MRLSCQKVFLLAAVFTVACRESTAPPSPVAGSYFLESINSRPLPAIIQESPGDTITVIFSTLDLDAAGNAVLVERLRFVHPNTPPTEATYTSGYVYRASEHTITGYDLTFEYSPPCPPNALCVEPPTGRIVGDALILSYGGSPAYRPPSMYRRAAVFPMD